MDELFHYIIAHFLAPFVRAFGMLLFLPIGEGVAGTSRKVSLAAIFALLPTPAALDIGEFSGALIKELFMGISIGFPIALLPAMASFWGELFDSVRGQNMATVYDPLHESSGALVGQFMQNFLWTSLCAFGALETVSATFVTSYKIVDVGALQFSSLPVLGRGIVMLISKEGTAVFTLFLPWAILCLLVEVVNGLLSKAAPGLSLSGESFFLKSALCFALLFLVISGLDLSAISRSLIGGSELLVRLFGSVVST